MRKRRAIFLSLILLLCLPTLALAFEPVGDTYAGVDVSVWQGEIDFTALAAAGIEVVYIRAAEELDEDSNFAANYAAARENGLKIGFYHYMTAASREQAVEQAQFFYSLVADKEYDCLLVLDYESFATSSKSILVSIAQAYLTELASLSGQTVAIYSDLSNAENIFAPQLAAYPLWIAEYGVSAPSDPGSWTEWVGFQYSDTGNVAGIDGDVDLDWFADGIFLSYYAATDAGTGGGAATGAGSTSGGMDASSAGPSGTTGAGSATDAAGEGDTGLNSWLMAAAVAVVALACLALAVMAGLRELRERRQSQAGQEGGPETATTSALANGRSASIPLVATVSSLDGTLVFQPASQATYTPSGEDAAGLGLDCPVAGAAQIPVTYTPSGEDADPALPTTADAPPPHLPQTFTPSGEDAAPPTVTAGMVVPAPVPPAFAPAAADAASAFTGVNSQPAAFDLELQAQRDLAELAQYKKRELTELEQLQQERERRELARLNQLKQQELARLEQLQQKARRRQEQLWALREQVLEDEEQ